MNSNIDILLKVVKFKLDPSVLQQRCSKRILKFNKKEIKQLTEHVVIVAFILFVEIYKNISVAKLVSVVYIQCIYLISRKLMFM